MARATARVAAAHRLVRAASGMPTHATVVAVVVALAAISSPVAAAPARTTRVPEASRGINVAQVADERDDDAREDRDGASADDGNARDGAYGVDRSARFAVALPNAPSIRAVIAAALAAAGLDRAPGDGWIWRTRLAGLVPWLTVRTARDTSWQDTHSEVGHGTSLEVRATWRLDRLLFDGRELQVATIEAARRRERARLASHVIRAYFAWRRAAEASTRAGATPPSARVDETTAELDALTDGWFSEELARPRPTSAGRPTLRAPP